MRSLHACVSVSRLGSCWLVPDAHQAWYIFYGPTGPIAGDEPKWTLVRPSFILGYNRPCRGCCHRSFDI